MVMSDDEGSRLVKPPPSFSVAVVVLKSTKEFKFIVKYWLTSRQTHNASFVIIAFRFGKIAGSQAIRFSFFFFFFLAVAVVITKRKWFLDKTHSSMLHVLRAYESTLCCNLSPQNEVTQDACDSSRSYAQTYEEL